MGSEIGDVLYMYMKNAGPVLGMELCSCCIIWSCAGILWLGRNDAMTLLQPLTRAGCHQDLVIKFLNQCKELWTHQYLIFSILPSHNPGQQHQQYLLIVIL